MRTKPHQGLFHKNTCIIAEPRKKSRENGNVEKFVVFVFIRIIRTHSPALSLPKGILVSLSFYNNEFILATKNREL
jgi:hypothetical protein